MTMMSAKHFMCGRYEGNFFFEIKPEINKQENDAKLYLMQGSIGMWQRCNVESVELVYTFDIGSSVKYHADLGTKGYRRLVYRLDYSICSIILLPFFKIFFGWLISSYLYLNSGDHDMGVPFLGTQAWIRSLNYSIVDDWRPWHVEGQVAGYVHKINLCFGFYFLSSLFWFLFIRMYLLKCIYPLNDDLDV